MNYQTHNQGKASKSIHSKAADHFGRSEGINSISSGGSLSSHSQHEHEDHEEQEVGGEDATMASDGVACFFLLLLLLTSSSHHPSSVADSATIDCGARKHYTDPKTNSSYRADDNRIVEYGEAHNVLSNYTKEHTGDQLKTLRSFPKGKWNCYTLPITPGNEDTHYLVRAFFAYGNYDDKRTIPSFDLYIGLDYWATFNQADGDIVRFEIIHVSPTTDDDINVCLVNTGHGIPFISLLEVFPWQTSRYDQTASSSLTLVSRSKLGMSEDDATYIRSRGSGRLNRKSDVDNFGIILLELITGHHAMMQESLGTKIQLLDWVTPKLNNGDIESIVDPRLEGEYNTSSAWKLEEIAMYCTQPTAIQRPDISEVLTKLKDCLASEITRERSDSSTRRSGDNSSFDAMSLNPLVLIHHHQAHMLDRLRDWSVREY